MVCLEAMQVVIYIHIYIYIYIYTYTYTYVNLVDNGSYLLSLCILPDTGRAWHWGGGVLAATGEVFSMQLGAQCESFSKNKGGTLIWGSF